MTMKHRIAGFGGINYKLINKKIEQLVSPNYNMARETIVSIVG